MHTATLCVRAASFTCALPLPDVMETLRPLPVRPLGGAPAHVLGLALVRGLPCVVVDANRLLGGVDLPTYRFVSLRTGSGQPMVLAVESVLGIRDLDLSSMQTMPRGLGTPGASRALGALDQNVLLSLDVQQLLRDTGLATVEGG